MRINNESISAKFTSNLDKKVMELTWKQRFDALKKHYKLTNTDIAAITGYRPDTIAAALSNNQREFPGWLKLAIVLYERNLNQMAALAEANQESRPLMLRSTYDRWMYQLNDGKFTNASIIIEAPLTGSEGLPGRHVSAFFVRKGDDYWWLDSPVTLIDDQPGVTPSFAAVDNIPYANGQFIIGLKTLWAGKYALFCQIINDELRQEYRFITIAKSNSKKKAVYDDRQIPIALFKNDFHQQLQKTFEKIEIDVRNAMPSV